MLDLNSGQKRFLRAVIILSGLCVVLYLVRVTLDHTWDYLYVPENLGLSWLALILSWVLLKRLKVRPWSSWQNIVLSVLWLFFLPNTWYVLTDYIHITSAGETSQLYDIVMIGSLVFASYAIGFASLYMVHKEFLKRRSRNWSHSAVAAILLLSSFAIYLGRDLRWSTWDVVSNPSGIILNVSDRIVDPTAHTSAFNVTALFFVLLSVLYVSLWLAFETPKKRSSRVS